MRSKKKRIRYDRIAILILVLGSIIFLCIKLFQGHEEEVLMEDVTEMTLDMVKEKYGDYDVIVSYEYSYDYDKNIVMSQDIKPNTSLKQGDKINLVVSKGEIEKDKLKSDGINELGKVPIMMYHGIKNILSNETAYVGGNVDKDGYTRTSEAFREDLEFYYKSGYRMIKLSDYINGNIDTAYGYSPIIITFDDGNANNILVNGLDEDGNIIIDKDSAVGILEEFKKKYPDYNVTAIFFVTNALFNQPEYNEKILHWLIDNGYEVGNHTKGHNDFKEIDTNKTQEVVGYMYNKLNSILGDKYSKIIALPFGSPYSKSHKNYPYIIDGTYNGEDYHTLGALRVGWDPEVSPFSKNFDPTFLKRCRAYDNNGMEFDIEMNFKNLEKTRYISDGNSKTIVTSSGNENVIGTSDKKIILY